MRFFKIFDSRDDKEDDMNEWAREIQEEGGSIISMTKACFQYFNTTTVLYDDGKGPKGEAGK
jgi:hypothetical protein